ncbi:MAG: hypothetical protein PHY30_00765 [Candidatus Pacebacteria bacterium]|nr:hypothetical protein [Candidatus Paceibacterota bacterium]
MDLYNPETRRVVELIKEYRENPREELIDEILKLMNVSREAECRGLLEIIRSEVEPRATLLKRYVDHKSKQTFKE